MGRSEWSYETSGNVDASPQVVVAWWFHSDRAEDLLRFAERIGATETALAETVEGGVRVLTYQWKDRRGWTYQHRAQAYVPSDGVSQLKDDRFVVPTGHVVTFKSPGGEDMMTETCHGRMEFIAVGDGGTTVKAFHKHSLEGGRWFWRVKSENQDRVNTLEMFRDSVARCQKAVS